jgi:hypothetical protein
MTASRRPRSWQERDTPSARAASLASFAALPVPPEVTVARADPHASSCTDPYARDPRTLSDQRKDHCWSCSLGGGVERPGRAVRFARLILRPVRVLSAAVDLWTVAGRLAHGGGGATTLRVYASFVAAADRRAAEVLGQRHRPPNTDA